MSRKIKDPGFGYRSGKAPQRLVNSDGSFNMKHLNKTFSLSEMYSYMIEMSWKKFFLLVFIGYILINLCFGLIYFIIGVDQLSVTNSSSLQNFLNAFYFSTQTITTLGYGSISPTGNIAAFVAAFEAFIGLLSFSFFTGLLYGRFSKPKAAIRFSDTFVVRQFKDERALMFRLMNKRKNIMIEPEINVTIAINKNVPSGEYKREFFQLPLERKKIMYLPTTWTIVHEIDKDSPLFKYTNMELKQLNAEIFVLLEYYEDSFSQKVYQLHSYDFNQLELDKKFVSAYFYDADGAAILDHAKLSETELV
ncbi:MAG: ion channel [Flavobacteriaceae bacterium]